MFDFLRDWTSWIMILVVGSLLGLIGGCAASGKLSQGSASGAYDPTISFTMTNSFALGFNGAGVTNKPLIEIRDARIEGEAATSDP